MSLPLFTDAVTDAVVEHQYVGQAGPAPGEVMLVV